MRKSLLGITESQQLYDSTKISTYLSHKSLNIIDLYSIQNKVQEVETD